MVDAIEIFEDDVVLLDDLGPGPAAAFADREEALRVCLKAPGDVVAFEVPEASREVRRPLDRAWQDLWLIARRLGIRVKVRPRSSRVIEVRRMA